MGHSDAKNLRKVLVSTAVAAAFLAMGMGGAFAHDPEKGKGNDQAQTMGHNGGAEIEGKRAKNTGKGMPSIRGPFPDSFGLEFVGQLTNEELGVSRLVFTGASFLSDIWGWTGPSGDEYALVGTSSGVAIVRIHDNSNPPGEKDVTQFLGLIPTTNPDTLRNFWWDLKVYNNHLYFVSEVIGSGVGIFELTQLEGMDEPEEDGILQVSARYDGDTQTILASHNISINEDTGFAYLTGATLDGGLPGSDEPVWILELEGDTSGEIPLPIEAGQIDSIFGEEIDSHDAHVLTYPGDDVDPNGVSYNGREIAIVAAGENFRLGIYDVTDKGNITEISAPGYAGASFTHQAWMSADGNWIFMGDEEDEVFGISDPRNPDLPDTTRIYVWNAQDLDAPEIYCTFDTPWAAIDHNMFEHEGKLYLANYTAGFVVFDVSSLDKNQDGCGIKILGHMDTEPRLPTKHMNNNINIFVGPWGIYPYFGSGKIIVSDGLNGLVIARLEPEE